MILFSAASKQNYLNGLLFMAEIRSIQECLIVLILLDYVCEIYCIHGGFLAGSMFRHFCILRAIIFIRCMPTIIGYIKRKIYFIKMGFYFVAVLMVQRMLRDENGNFVKCSAFGICSNLIIRIS